MRHCFSRRVATEVRLSKSEFSCQGKYSCFCGFLFWELRFYPLASFAFQEKVPHAEVAKNPQRPQRICTSRTSSLDLFGGSILFHHEAHEGLEGHEVFCVSHDLCESVWICGFFMFFSGFPLSLRFKNFYTEERSSGVFCKIFLRGLRGLKRIGHAKVAKNFPSCTSSPDLFGGSILFQPRSARRSRSFLYGEISFVSFVVFVV